MGGNLLWRCVTEYAVAKQPLRNRRAGKIWLPIVDAFRSRVACPPPAVRAVFQQIQSLQAGEHAEGSRISSVAVSRSRRGRRSKLSQPVHQKQLSRFPEDSTDCGCLNSSA